MGLGFIQDLLCFATCFKVSDLGLMHNLPALEHPFPLGLGFRV
jgi:hypothetical protein